MAEMQFRYQNSLLCYEVTGTGPKALIMFHGFGQDRGAFRSLFVGLSEDFTIYAIDLYFHGKSVWGNDEIPLEKSQWREIVAGILKRHEIGQFSLAGFSLGGKFVLATLESFPEKIHSIFLLAPDGIKTSFWYNLATYPLPFRALFKKTIRQPRIFIDLARLLNTFGIMDKGLLRFAEQQMDTAEKRWRVYSAWVVFRHFKFNMKAISKLILDHKIQLTIIAGKYDRVIVPDAMRTLLRRLKNYRFIVAETGHNGVIGASLPYFKTVDT